MEAVAWGPEHWITEVEPGATRASRVTVSPEYPWSAKAGRVLERVKKVRLETQNWVPQLVRRAEKEPARRAKEQPEQNDSPSRREAVARVETAATDAQAVQAGRAIQPLVRFRPVLALLPKHWQVQAEWRSLLALARRAPVALEPGRGAEIFVKRGTARM
ncbi:MAG: hypothetical protein ACJ746_16535 [Bryobacteraceae bacterium]